MSTPPRDPAAAILLLKTLEARARPASEAFAEALREHPANGPATVGQASSPVSPKPEPAEARPPRPYAILPYDNDESLASAPSLTPEPTRPRPSRPAPDLSLHVPNAIAIHPERDSPGSPASPASSASAAAAASPVSGPCRLVVVRAPLDGSRTAQGYSCPARAHLEGLEPARVREAIALLARDDRFLAIAPDRIAFLDTETTSLSAGAGTVAFLVGVGRLRGDEFVVKQFFLEDFDRETTMLEAVAAELAGAEALAGYNSRCFDAPLLETRFRMNGLRPAFPAPHLDLLHPARRLWKGRLPDCRLGTVEREVLRLARLSDVESMFIPSIFLDYVRGIRPRRIVPVLDHHAQDVIGLYAVLAAMVRATLDADATAFDHASDHWGVSSLLHAAGREAESLDRLERAILAARDEEVGYRLSMHLAKRYARAGREEEAVEIWRARAPMSRAPDRLEPLIALARHYERGARDLAEARRWAERALAAAERDAELRELLGVAAGTSGAAGAAGVTGEPRSEEARALERLSLLIEGLRRRVERIDRRRAKPPRESTRRSRRKDAD